MEIFNHLLHLKPFSRVQTNYSFWRELFVLDSNTWNYLVFWVWHSTASNDEALWVWRMWSTPSFPLLSGTLWLWVIVLIRVPSIVQIELFNFFIGLLLYCHLQHHNDTINKQTPWLQTSEGSCRKYIPLNLFAKFEKVVWGSTVRGSLETEHKL